MTQQDADRMPATVREWTDILARIRFGTVKIAGKSYAAVRIKAVAGRMASYADGDGTRVRPGVARVAVDLEVEYRTVRDVIAYLRRLGLLKLVRAGGGTRASEYRLTLPVDLLDRDDLSVWSPSQQMLEIERALTRHRGAPRTPPRGPRGQSTQGPEDSTSNAAEPVTQGPQDSTSAPESASDAGSSGASKPADVESSGTATQGPQDPTTNQDLDTTTTHHDDNRVIPNLTVPRASRPPANPESPPLPKRCEHGLPGGRRRDGQLACPICRRVARTAAPAGERLASVIQLHREVS